MRKWFPIALIALAILWYGLTAVGSSQALDELGLRPVQSLLHEGERVAVQPPVRAAAPGEAAIVASRGIHFGFSTTYQMPDGGSVTCRYRFRRVSCSDGWTPERAP